MDPEAAEGLEPLPHTVGSALAGGRANRMDIFGDLNVVLWHVDYSDSDERKEPLVDLVR